MNTTIITVVILYLLVMLAIGYYASKKINNNEDFMVAGRRLGPLLMAGTLAATEIGGGSSLGVVEKAFGDWGMSAAWYVLTMAITFGILVIFGPKLRKSMVKTIPEYFRKRYGEAPGAITAIIMILPLIGLTASQFIASAVILSVMTGLSYTISVIIVAIVVTAYSVMGGLWSVTLTDFVQVFLIVGGMALAIPYALNMIGGWDNVVANIPAEKLSFTQGIGIKGIISLVIMYTASFTVGQEAVCRYYAAKDDKAAVKGSLYAGIINIVYAFIPTVLGLITLALINTNRINADFIMANGARYALPTLAIQTMPPIVCGLLFAGIISATMSSADSDLLGAGSIFGNDIYKIYIKKDASDKEVLRVTQLSMLIVGILSLGIALRNSGSIINLLMFSFTLRAGGAFIPYILGHYYKKSSKGGAMASLIVGSVVSLLVERKIISFFGLDPIIPGLIFSALVFFIFCKLYPPKIETTEFIEVD
ncbi:sodium:solute symporter family protein [Clostridium sp.]|uniref:sodium:solute symporter family protein n=1 Tax=Clostridium sp. TaxID=1506 RepID=UPI003452E6F1